VRRKKTQKWKDGTRIEGEDGGVIKIIKYLCYSEHRISLWYGPVWYSSNSYI
jgi:hypothetical protein